MTSVGACTDNGSKLDMAILMPCQAFALCSGERSFVSCRTYVAIPERPRCISNGIACIEFACRSHWMTVVRDRFTGALILETAYGCSLKSREDNALRKMLEVTEETSATAGVLAATLVDLFPALVHIPTWMPGAGFKRRALQLRKQLRQVIDDPFQKVKRELAVGTAQKSFVSSLLRDPDRSHWPEDYEEEIKGTAAVLYGAGLDTSAIVLSSFLLAMVLHPEVYRQAQEEIDGVVENQRLPEPQDRSSLPFLECVLKEVYRYERRTA
ncbi:cytochrome P450 [Laetiporus sulphureus 93-53]|uniref:Cytochrome P450 n=1 Tax=Laetiporus sulphureus 93-53 TaxID=1314785 RepID=A0A165BXJ3_9APHY|nr:cytochrome P450 [Laetiporus sulphureus 93-53]KZT01836.1 cytochrome P450 [Laetiporus sulphureus 93-53]